MTPRSVMFADVSPPFSASTAQVAALIVSHGGVPRWWSTGICTPHREMDFSAWEKWICGPFLTDLCRAVKKQLGSGFTAPAFHSHFRTGGNSSAAHDIGWFYPLVTAGTRWTTISLLQQWLIGMWLVYLFDDAKPKMQNNAWTFLPCLMKFQCM